jgi:hypothetical protein
MVPYCELSDLLPREEVARLAGQYHVDAVNQIQLTGETVFACLLHEFLNHNKVTQRMLEATFEEQFGRDIHYSTFSKRLAGIHPEYFEAIFRTLFARVQPVMTFAEERRLRVRIVDATLVVLSAKLMAFGIHFRSGGTAGKGHNKRHVKSVLTLSGEGLPDFLRLCGQQSEASDNVALGEAILAATHPGDLWIVDGGLTDRDRLLSIHDKQAFFLVPHNAQKLRVTETVWEAKPAPAPKKPSEALFPEDTPAGQVELRTPPPCRLVRVLRAVFENADDAVRPGRQEKWGRMPLLVFVCERYDVRSKEWKPLVLLTNLPLSEDRKRAGPYMLAEIPELYRRRWEIETLIQFLKQHLSYDHLTSRCENGIRVMIWMALIVAVLLIWFQRRTGIDRGWRVVKFWFACEAQEWAHHRVREELWELLGQESG